MPLPTDTDDDVSRFLTEIVELALGEVHQSSSRIYGQPARVGETVIINHRRLGNFAVDVRKLGEDEQ